MKIDSYNFLSFKEILTFHNVIIFGCYFYVKSAVNKSKDKCYHNIFLETGSYKYKSNRPYFQMNGCILYDKIDVSERIDVNKTSASNNCDIFHYWYF